MANSLPLRIFLASPRDLLDERKIVQECVSEHNERYSGADFEKFEVVGWEQVRGTARRPQDAINELISESHFLVVLFKSAWGSESGSPWGYTSGTEEELFTGLLELGEAGQPMRDVWVAFFEEPNAACQIVDLRNQMSAEHSIMYETISGPRDLQDKLTSRLNGWAEPRQMKVARHVELLPSSGKDILKATRLRRDGEKLVELGDTSGGRNALEEAAVLGGPDEKLAYSKFLARHGELNEAREVIDRAIEYVNSETNLLYTPLAAEIYAEQAGILRRQGRNMDAIGRLEQSLTLLDERVPNAEMIRCRILDVIGHTHRKLKNFDAARDRFEEAFNLRRGQKRGLEEAQSLINLARIALDVGDLEAANSYIDHIQRDLNGTPPNTLHANAYGFIAEVRLQQGRAVEGIPFAQRALALNQQLANKYGEAISLCILAESLREEGNTAKAEEYAYACLELNRKIGNEFGMKRAREILNQLGRELA